MSEVTDILVPMRRGIQKDLSNLKEDMRHIKTRMSFMEENVVAFARRLAPPSGGWRGPASPRAVEV